MTARPERLILAAVLGTCPAAWAAGEAPSVPMPAAPEVPEMPEPEAPSLPSMPELPSAGPDRSRIPEGYTGPTRLVLDHRQRFLLLPRFGYSQMLANTDAEAVRHVSAGLNAQIAFNRRVFLSVEGTLVRLVAGGYGLIYESYESSLKTYTAGETTFSVAVGPGLFTTFLDGQELWTRVSVQAAYLHPFYAGVWITPDIQRELVRTDDWYWVATLSPQVGAMVPIHADGTQILTGARAWLGMTASTALIFGAR